MSNIIIPSEASLRQGFEEGLAEVTAVEEAPDLMGIADKHRLLSNLATPPLPSWVNDALLNVGGRNKFGEPNFKAVYGQSELHHAWGQQRLKYPAVFVNDSEQLGYDIHNANGKVHFVKGSNLPKNLKPGSFVVPRYRKTKTEVGLPFWIIERWFDITEVFQPTEYFFEPLDVAWEKEVRWAWDEETGERIDNMGPFPARGVYQHFFTVKTPDFNYRPIADDVIDIVAMTLEIERGVASGKEYRVLLHNMLEKRKEKEKSAISDLREKMEDAFNTPRLLGNASVTVPENIGE